MFECRDGWLWVSSDKKLMGDMHTIADLDDHVLPVVKGRSVAVQAGGAMGVWPKRLSCEFDTVYTFEPTPESFHCLCINAPELNIIKFNAALGNEHKMVHTQAPGQEDNFGARWCKDGGNIPVLRVDDLHLSACDLIMLDIEGYEYFALQGAKQTIERFSPVIVLEDKNCCERYGKRIGDVERLLKIEHKYARFQRFHNKRDVLCQK